MQRMAPVTPPGAFRRRAGAAVTLSGRTGTVCWLSTPTAKGIRTFTIRQKAGTFGTPEDAQIAIERMHRVR